MKAINKTLSAVLLSSTLLVASAPTLATSVVADSIDNQSSNVSSNTLSKDVVKRIDPYVEVKNNKYILNEEAKNVVTPSEYSSAKEVIDNTNQMISDSSFKISKTSKTASLDIEISKAGKVVSVLPSTPETGIQSRRRYHYGVNKVTVGWNYVRVYIDKQVAKTAVAGGSGAISGIVGNAIGGIAGAAIGGAIGNYLSSVIGDNIKGGLWFDVNWILTAYHQAPIITAWGWQ